MHTQTPRMSRKPLKKFQQPTVVAAAPAPPAAPPIIEGDSNVALRVLMDLLTQIRRDERLGRPTRDGQAAEAEAAFASATRGSFPQNDYVIDDGTSSLAGNANASKIQRRRDRRVQYALNLAKRSEELPGGGGAGGTGSKRGRESQTTTVARKGAKGAASSRKSDDDDGSAGGSGDGDSGMQEVTLEAVIEQLARDDSLLRSLFLETLANNYEAWLIKIIEMQAAIKERSPDVDSFDAASGKRKPKTGTRKDGGGGGSAEEKRKDELKMAQERDDEILWDRMTRIAADLRTENQNLLLYSTREPPAPGTAPRVRREGTDPIGDAVLGYVDRVLVQLRELSALVGLVSLKDNVAILLLTTWLTSRDNTSRKLFADHRNFLLLGNPGVGKTKSAILLRNILRSIGVLVDHRATTLTTYSRAELVASYTGQTAPTVRRAFVENWGSSLFIDEFYSLITNEPGGGGGGDEFGEEAVSALVKLTEDYKGQVVVIGAGYKDLIQRRVLASNPGLNSRFPYKWTLPTYSAAQLNQIQLDWFREENVSFGGGAGGDISLTSSTTSMGGAQTPALTTPSPSPAAPPPSSRAKQLLLRITDPIVILRDLTAGATAAGFFSEQNARGARALSIAVDTERQRRLARAVISMTRTEAYNANAPVLAVDVYRGFANWIYQSQDTHVVYLDDSVDALVGDTD